MGQRGGLDADRCDARELARRTAVVLLGLGEPVTTSPSTPGGCEFVGRPFAVAAVGDRAPADPGAVRPMPFDPVKPVSHRTLVRLVTASASSRGGRRAVVARRRRGPNAPMGGSRLRSSTARAATACHREVVALLAEAHDRAGGDRRDHARVPPGFAGVRIGDVHLDDGPVERGQRIVDRPGVVRERAGVDDDRRRIDRGRGGCDRSARPRGSTDAPRSTSPCRSAAARWRTRRGRRACRCRRSPAHARRAGSGSARARASPIRSRSITVLAAGRRTRAASPRTGRAVDERHLRR